MLLADVIEVVRSLAPSPDAPIDAGSGLVADLGFDSFRVVELAAALENRFGFVFDEDELDFEEFTTPGQITALVERCLAGASSSA